MNLTESATTPATGSPEIDIRLTRDSDGWTRYDAYARIAGEWVLITWDCLSETLDAEIAAWVKQFRMSTGASV